VSKQSGLGDNLYVGGYDLSGDIGAIDTITSPRAVQDVTGIDKSAMERLHLLRDGTMEFTSFWNSTTGQAQDRLSLLPYTDVICSYCRGTSLGSPGAAMVAKQVDYNPSRGIDGSLTCATAMQANGYGLEWGVQLTAGKRADTTATNGTGVDFTASTAFGLTAYLQVFAFTGTSVTVKIQESSDNGGADAFADVTGGGFTAATGITTQRIQTTRALTVERYLRVVTTGTFSAATFSVIVCKHPETTVF
jgi:hypothetical protein